MTRTCPFENRSHKEFFIESLQNQTNPGENIILRHCSSFTFPKQALVFTCLQCESFENTVGKREIALYE